MKNTFCLILLSFSFIIFGSSIFYSNSTPYELNLPVWFPKPEIPEDNQLTLERVKLGKMLFYDKILSLNNSISCSSCHAP